MMLQTTEPHWPEHSVDIFYRYRQKRKGKKEGRADIKNRILLRAYFDYSQLLLLHCINFTLLNIEKGPSPLGRN